MDAARYARLHELYDAARARPAGEREAFVARVRTEDAELGAELAGLCSALASAQDSRADGSGAAAQFLGDEAIGAARQRLEALSASGAVEGLPERVGPYRILRRVGQGGMGVVYEAEQSAPQRRVALKMIPLTSGGVERLKRFQLEGEVLGRLHHPNIAQVFECGTADLGHGPQPFFAMEFVEGVDLYSFALRANLGIEAKLKLVARVADAVQHAHERGVVHRDLKPDNVLVEASGEPKVLDFGVARASDTSHVLSSAMTQTGELVGTLAYMAPEQLSGSRGAVGPRVDVYALGVILYQLLAARLPHEVAGLPLTAAMQVLAHADPLPVARHDPRCAGDVTTIVAKAMEKDPARRYASAAELAADLRRHLEHLPITARPASVIYRLKKTLRRNRGLVTGLVAVFVVLLAGLAGTLWQAREAKANAEHALGQAYSANMLLADVAFSRAQLAAARAGLEAAPESRRGWEWRVLAARLDSSARSQRRDLPRADEYDNYNRLELILHPGGHSYWTTDSRLGGMARRWSLASGELLAEFPHPDLQASRTESGLSPDGSRLWMISGNAFDSFQRARWSEWDIATGRRFDLPAPTAPGLNFVEAPWQQAARSPGGSLWLSPERGIAVSSPGSAELRVYLHPNSSIQRITFDREGSLAALLSPEGTWIQDTATLELVALIEEQASANCVAFSPDGRRAATGVGDGSTRIWDLTSRPVARLMTLKQAEEVYAVAFSPDGARLATLARDRNIRVWDPATGALLDTFGTSSLSTTALAFLSESEVAGLELNGSLVTWDLDARATTVLEGHANTLRGAVPLPHVGLIASGAWDGFHGRPGALRLWDAESGDPVAACLGVDEAVYALGVAPDGSTLVVSLNARPKREPYLLLIETRSGRTSRLRLPRTADSPAFDPTGSRIAASPHLGPTLVVPVDFGRAPIEIPIHSRCVTWSQDGRFLALGCKPEVGEEGPGTVLLDATSLTEVRRFESGETLSVALSRDGQTLATAGVDAIVRLWDVASGTLVASLTGHDRVLYALAFSPDGQRLASAGLDNTIRLWDTRTFAPVGVFSGHTGHVASLAWDGERLISSSGDDTARIWEPEPVRTRLAARELRRAAVARVQPLVTRLLVEQDSPEAVLSALARETGLDSFDRKVAHQLALGAALERVLK